MDNSEIIFRRLWPDEDRPYIESNGVRHYSPIVNIFNDISSFDKIINSECTKDLYELKPDMEIKDKSSFLFSVSMEDKLIFTTIPTLEYLWTCSYYYFVHYYEFEKSRIKNRNRKYFHTSKNKHCHNAFLLHEWARNKMINNDRSYWPKNIPTPVPVSLFGKLNKKRRKRKENRYAEGATAGFIYAVNWIMLHEVAHIKLKHKKHIGEDKSISINIENEADEYATKSLLPDTASAIGIAIALLSIQSDEIRRNTAIRNSTHPQTFERIYRCLCEHAEIKDDDIAYRFCIRTIQLQLCWHYYKENLSKYEEDIASAHEKSSLKYTLREYIFLLYQLNK